jgi:hypothetical protein
MRTEVLRGVHSTRPPGAQGHWGRTCRRGRRGMSGHLLTGGAVGFVSKACKYFGFARALAGWGGRCRWTLAWGALAWPGILEHQEQPDECDQRQLGEKKVWNHGDAPSQQCEMGALYRVLTTLGLSASYGYTTNVRETVSSGTRLLSLKGISKKPWRPWRRTIQTWRRILSRQRNWRMSVESTCAAAHGNNAESGSVAGCHPIRFTTTRAMWILQATPRSTRIFPWKMMGTLYS